MIDPNTGKEVDKVVIPGEGTYTIDPSGKVTFTPDPNFTGEGKGIVVKRVDKNDTAATAKYTPTVKAETKHPKAASANKAKALPKTGNEDNNANTTLLGSILALFGLAAFSRRKKEDK